MTHAELVKKAERWLLNTKGCSFAFSELSAYTKSGETPDAIGWKGIITILVECKASRADFFSDGRKRFRRDPDRGMGDFRFYMAPAGMLTVFDLEQNPWSRSWGLVEVYPNGRARQRRGPEGNTFAGHSAKRFRHRTKCWRSETHMMVSALRRLHIRGLLPEIYNQSSRPLRRRSRKG